MVVDLTRSLEEQVWLTIILRDANHHVDENAEPKGAAFDFGRVDVFDVGSAIDYGKRYDDVAYWRIRGREQQLIDSLGGFTTRPQSGGVNATLTQGIRHGANAEIL
ncbi:hypothetical protein F0U59_37895 [Archangium gephyra]|nr:hypothetical protein F0U59_37895 [Archangium gephyra]